jgi:outer membrane protein TolC
VSAEGQVQVKLRFRWMALACLALCSAPRLPAQVSLYSAVDLALRNSAAVRIATADMEKAVAILSQSRDVYVPSAYLGSGIGYSYGFPVGQPSIFNMTSQSLLVSFSQPDYIRAARAGLKSTQLALKDVRQQVVLDTSLNYIQLSKTTREIAALDEESTYADRLLAIEQQRLDAGVEPRVELTKARLTAARIHLKRLHLDSDAAVLRTTLAHLTGMPAATFITDDKSIPPPPEFNRVGDLDLLVANINPSVQSAYAGAKSRLYTSFGDSRQVLRPQVNFVLEYARYATFNNYADYYKNFQSNNFGVGVQITIPLWDSGKKSKARESTADAAHSLAQADLLRDQTEEQALRLQKSIAELQAQAQVAALQRELAQDQLDTVIAQLESGSGQSSSAPMTPREEQSARIEERQRFEDSLDADFELTRARLTLLRTIGSVEDWAKTLPSN